MKGDEGIGTYAVDKKPLADQPILQLLPYSVGKFRFRFDSYITTHGYDSHSLIVKDFTVNEVKDYTINIKDEKGEKILFNRSVMLRHFGKVFRSLCITNSLPLLSLNCCIGSKLFSL